jgi:Icc-related predicted phosphoesterase
VEGVKIVLISDTHTKHRFLVPEGDMVIHAGDVCSYGTLYELKSFLDWFSTLPHKYKIFIAGNHCFPFQKETPEAASLVRDYPGIIYLEESGVEIEGIKIWGSPWTPYFFNWAFNYQPEDAYKYWEKIPLDINILITHGPPYGILDDVGNTRYNPDRHVGCPELLLKINELKDLRLHVFGHIHCGRGILEVGKTTFCNASILNDDYKYYDSTPFICNY